jgi:tRNA (cytidine56-2'-O)-methyltransferase
LELADRITAVSRRWGGAFAVVGVAAWKPVLEQFKGGAVHLTMYGEPLQKVLPEIRRTPRLLIVVGGAKVPRALYRESDYNVAVGSQPHSEVAALAVLLDRLLGGAAPSKFRGAEQRIIPQRRGKRVVRTPKGRSA